MNRARRDPRASSLSRRLVTVGGAGLLAAVFVGFGGSLLERSRMGASEADTLARLERALQHRFEASAATLASIAIEVAAERELLANGGRDTAAAARLFSIVASVLPDEGTGDTGITVYNAAAAPVAWGGRVSEIPAARLTEGPALFVAPSALGPRLVRIEPVGEVDRPASRIATVVVEQLLAEVSVSPGRPDTFVLPTTLAPVTLRTRVGDATTASPYTFVIPSAAGHVLVEALVDPADLSAARDGFRRRTRASILTVLGLTLLFCAAPLVDVRRRGTTPRSFLIATASIALLLVSARLVLGLAATQLTPTVAEPATVLMNALFAAAIVWLGFDLVERWRVSRPLAPLRTKLQGAGDPVRLASPYVVAAFGAAGLLWSYIGLVRALFADVPTELLYFSLHPWEPTRLVIALSLPLMHAAVIWGAVTFVRLAGRVGRAPSDWPGPGLVVTGWLVGAVTGGWMLAAWAPPVPFGPFAVTLTVTGVCAVAVARLRPRLRHGSQALRLGVVYLALLAPAVSMYPVLHAFSAEAKERLVATEYGPRTANLRDDLQESLRRALETVDDIQKLSAFLAPVPPGASPPTEPAFQIWSQTDLADSRLTSGVELYGRDGQLLSRFALNLPDYSVPSAEAVGCDWDILDEAAFFGSAERHVLRASRGICDDGLRLGTIVVRAMLDYRTLPFIASQSPYLESLRSEPMASNDIHGMNPEVVVYGWSRAPMNVSGRNVFPLSESVFQRMVGSREPFWTTIARDDGVFRVYLMNDRGGIYAVGIPVLTGVGHLVNLAELVVLVGILYVLLLAGAAAFNAAGTGAPSSGRALLREFRSSFYRKLSLAFVGVAVVPVIALALATRAYFANELLAEVEESAVQTATVAQRLVEDYATLQQRSAGTTGLLDDQIMVLVSRAIDQSVNLFDGPELQATSERDLFASRLLPGRTPADVYRSIVLEQMPSFVGEEQVGEFRYLVAAAPVRQAATRGIVTVPQTLRRRESERQRDELDRRVLSASVLFVLLGLALGYSMAERIADPVNRLTRATRRIARGDLDARIAATSSDELRRLVEDFNHMAADLQRQRAELERTQRLEAWAEMARQVAHDIKNPLTPIQLSAEHARRINLDRGRPLSPVLDDCVNAILTQVRLLRQISAEFSSFASSPTARPEPTNLPALINEVLEPYRAGLSGRIAIDVRTSPDLPAAFIDRTLFARALTNIIENALHAMPGRGHLVVEGQLSPGGGGRGAAGDRTAGDDVIVRIADTGVGMDREALEKIFEPYFSTKASGTGLGLTIAKRNVELNGGTISIESERGVGSTVTLTLPVAR